MATASVRKFLISVDPEEPLDYAEPLEYFEEVFTKLGLEKVGTYTFRYSDQECMIKINLAESADGFYVYGYVQATCEHAYRLEQIAEELGGAIMNPSARAS
jgi:FAD/FMN-containing dehydrogenase